MPFRTRRKIAGPYVFANLGPSAVIRHARNLAKKAGLKPSDFKVDRQNSPRRD